MRKFKKVDRIIIFKRHETQWVTSHECEQNESVYVRVSHCFFWLISYQFVILSCIPPCIYWKEMVVKERKIKTGEFFLGCSFTWLENATLYIKIITNRWWTITVFHRTAKQQCLVWWEHKNGGQLDCVYYCEKLIWKVISKLKDGGSWLSHRDNQW